MYKWIEVNLDAIKNNYVKVRENIDPKTKILAVVKADAYGHGLIEVSKELVRQGVDYLGVTEIAEGIKLREAGLSVPILVFGSFLSEDAFYFQEFKLTATLADLETIKKVIVQNLKFTFHLKVETGLGRTGLKYDQLAKFVEIIRDNNDIIFEGVYSHLATSMWSDNSFSKKQFSEFTKAIDFLKSHGFNPPLKHICNSAAFVKFPEMHLDMVRAGTILYGQEVAGQREFQGHLQKAWSLKGQITYINELPRDHSIGYERSYILKAPAKTAIVPIGFHHGFSVEPIPRPKGFIDLVKVIGKTLLRYFDHHRVRTYARVRDKDVPVLGKVGMQQTVLDVSTIPDIQVGDIVELPGRRTNISPELPKVYLKDGKPQQISRISEKYELVRGTSSYD